MSFRFNVDLRLDFPRPAPRDGTQTQLPTSTDQEQPQQTQKGFPGWLHTARQHPRYSLRLLYFIACIIGIILSVIVVGNIYVGDVQGVQNTAIGLLIAGLFWQLIAVYDTRLFQGRQLPNWAIAVVETLGFLGFLALIIGSAGTVQRHEGRGGRGGWGIGWGEMVLVAYSSSVWVVCCLVNTILAIQCYAQGVKNVRRKRAVCVDCERHRGKGKGVANDDEEALLGEEEETVAGPSEQANPAPYRDEEERGEAV